MVKDIDQQFSGHFIEYEESNTIKTYGEISGKAAMADVSNVETY